MKVEKAIVLLKNLDVKFGSQSDMDTMNLAIDALALMEKREQGLVVELPCKVGEKCWCAFTGPNGEQVSYPVLLMGAWTDIDGSGLSCRHFAFDNLHATRSDAEAARE